MTKLTRRSAIALASSAALAPLMGCQPEAKKPEVDAAAAKADADFAALGQKWLDESAKLNPTNATGRGDHRFDSELDDVSAAGRASRADARKAQLASLAAIDRTKLNRENQVDAAMLSDQLASESFMNDELEAWAWDPLRYNDIGGGSIYSLMARDFAPVKERLLSAAARMEKMPELLNQTRGQLVAERVPLIHAQTYSRQNGGAVSIIDDLVLSQADVLGPDDKKRLMDAAAKAKAAVAEHQKWIDKELVPKAKGDFRVGKHYDKKLRFSIDSPIPKEELLAKAKADLDRVTTEMYEIARKELAGVKGAPPTPDAPTPEQRQKAVRAAVDIAQSKSPAREKLFEEARMTLEDATKFVAEHQIITLPDAPVKVIEMPKFQQGVSVAYCDSPGPLDRKLDTFYAISPIPKDWTAVQTASFLKEYNSRALFELTIHEAMPGHYVQLWHSNKHPSVLRAVLGSGSFIEGWAVYAQDVMIEAGHGGGDPLRKLVNLKWALRVISNTILDQGIHVEGWDEKTAMDFMIRDAFQEEREAAGKWTRARVSSGQLASYYLGWSEHLSLRKDAQAKEGANFNMKTYHDSILSHGSPPGRLVRQIYFNEPIA
jgi:uncharacterized protein (DUF885 family)